MTSTPLTSYRIDGYYPDSVMPDGRHCRAWGIACDGDGPPLVVELISGSDGDHVISIVTPVQGGVPAIEEQPGFTGRLKVVRQAIQLFEIKVPRDRLSLTGDPSDGYAVFDLFLRETDPAPCLLGRGTPEDFTRLLSGLADLSGHDLAVVFAFDGHDAYVDKDREGDPILPSAVRTVAGDIVAWHRPSGGHVFDHDPEDACPVAFYYKPSCELDADRRQACLVDLTLFYEHAMADLELDPATIEGRLAGLTA